MRRSQLRCQQTNFHTMGWRRTGRAEQRRGSLWGTQPAPRPRSPREQVVGIVDEVESARHTWLRPCGLAEVLPKPDKRLSAHPAIPPDPYRSLGQMSLHELLVDILCTGLVPYRVVRYLTSPVRGMSCLEVVRCDGRVRRDFLPIVHTCPWRVPRRPCVWQDCVRFASSLEGLVSGQPSRVPWWLNS
jgi:hypothetical protein